MHRFSVLSVLLVLALAILANAGDVTIQVGTGNASMSFSPNWVEVSPGDVVTWTWVQGHHTVVQGPGQGTCAKLVGGFYSPSLTSGSYSWTVTGTGPWYYFCAVPGHCVKGMWGVLAVPGSTNTIPSTTAVVVVPSSSIAVSSSASSSSVASSNTNTALSTAGSSGNSSSANSSTSATPTSSTSAAAYIQVNWALGVLALVGWAALLV